MSDMLKIEVCCNEHGNPIDELVIHKVGSDTSKWDYILKLDVPTVNKLPQWLRRKLAVLQMRSYDPPTEDIPDIGMRISKWEFWVYINEGEQDGDDPRKESEAACC